MTTRSGRNYRGASVDKDDLLSIIAAKVDELEAKILDIENFIHKQHQDTPNVDTGTSTVTNKDNGKGVMGETTPEHTAPFKNSKDNTKTLNQHNPQASLKDIVTELLQMCRNERRENYDSAGDIT